MLGITIFGITGLVGSSLSENLVFAQEELDGATTDLEVTPEDFSLIKQLVDSWNSAIKAIENAIDSLQSQVDNNSAAIDEIQTKLGAVPEGGVGLGASSGIQGSGGISTYSVTVSGTISSGSPGLVIASCNEGDVAISGTHEIISEDSTYITIYDSEAEDPADFDVPAFNSHPTNDIQIDATVNCIESTDTEFSKADSGFS